MTNDTHSPVQVEIEPGIGAWDASSEVLDAAYHNDSEARTDFNGTPMVAFTSDHAPQAVYLRWHYERLIIQIRNGVLRAEDVVLS